MKGPTKALILSQRSKTMFLSFSQEVRKNILTCARCVDPSWGVAKQNIENILHHVPIQLLTLSLY